jgi:iron-sulfur cluster assembly accessory protein
MTATLAANSVSLTPAAAARVRTIAERQGRAAQLRLSVEGGGCSGFTYKFGMADSIDGDDIVTVTDGAELVVDTVSLDLLRGSLVDFVDNLGGSHFQVTNPNAAAGCGCGSSFTI